MLVQNLMPIEASSARINVLLNYAYFNCYFSKIKEAWDYCAECCQGGIAKRLSRNNQPTPRQSVYLPHRPGWDRRHA